MKNRMEIKAFIENLEKKFPVDEWIINEKEIWPLLRIKLSVFLIFALETSLDIKNTPPPHKEEKWSIFNRSKRIRRLKAFITFRKLKPKSILFSGAYSQRSLYKNKSYGKFSDPIIDYFKDDGIIIEHSAKYKYNSNNIYKKNRVLFLDDIKELKKPSKHIKSIKQQVFLEKYNEFLYIIKNEELLSTNYSYFEIKSLLTIINKFENLEYIYYKILKRVKPEKVFTICYYSFETFVLNYTANKLNIKTIEIQHGPQGNNHLSYTNWEKIPPNGFNLLPKVFWQWDKYSFSVVNEWANNKKQHYCLIAGNPWVDFIKKGNNKNKDIILYTLQPFKMDFLFPQYIINEIKNKKELNWWIRLHPRQLNNINEFKTFIKTKKIDHLINYSEATNLSLPEVLSKTKIHITNSSGCTLEAIQFGIPTILIDRIACDAFNEIINEKKAFFVNTKIEFKSKLDELLLKNEKEYKITNKKTNYKDVFKNL